MIHAGGPFGGAHRDAPDAGKAHASSSGVDAQAAQRYIAGIMPSPAIREPAAEPDGPFPAAGGARAIIARACSAIARSTAPALAIVLETTGSTYVSAASIALFEAQTQTGWLSGGCLEPEIARRAAVAVSGGSLGWMEVDTRDDAALFAGAALGCRGRLRLALLPLLELDGWSALGELWLQGRGPMEWSISSDGRVQCRVGPETCDWTLQSAVADWETDEESTGRWTLRIDAPPRVILHGVGPEAPLLVPLLRSMGWMTRAVEPRPRWFGIASLADQHRETAAASDLLAWEQPFAALVMHHNFELDLHALLALSENPPPYIGLLGPRRRRDDLFRLLPETARERLHPRLHSPAGLDLGGRGPEAIALSIAAQLQARWHQRQPGYT